MDFSQIPDNNLVPGSYTEFDKSGAVQGDPAKPHRVLLVGLVPATSTITKDTPIPATSEGEVLAAAGKSQLAAMAWGFFRKNRRVRTDILAIEEPSGGATAVGKVEVTGAATETGTFTVVLNGVNVQVGVVSGDTASDVHTAIKDAIDDAIDLYPHILPVSAAVSVTPDVEITSLFKGDSSNQMTVSVDGEIAGLTFAVTDFAGGSGTETVTTAIANLGDTQYDTIIVPSSDAIADWDALVESRWDATVKKDGMIFTAHKGTHGTLTTLGGTLNSEFLSVMGTGTSPTPAFVWAAQIGAGDALNPDSPRPRKGMTLPDCKPPAEADRFDHDERQLLLAAGISTFLVGASGSVYVERLITTYTEDDVSGAPDPVYRNVSTMRNLAYLRWSWDTLLELRYPDFNLADDGTQFDPGVKVATPSVFRGEAVSWFRRQERAGRVENFEAFQEALLVERDGSDAERVNTSLPPDLVNELVTIANRIAFRL